MKLGINNNFKEFNKMKKLIIYITILSVMNIIGCYYQEQMNPSDYTFDENSSIEITTIDTVYNFNGDDYHLENDTLFGKLSIKLDERKTLKTNVEIPVVDMVIVELERSDAIGSVLLTLGVLVGIIVVPFVVLMAGY